LGIDIGGNKMSDLNKYDKNRGPSHLALGVNAEDLPLPRNASGCQPKVFVKTFGWPKVSKNEIAPEEVDEKKEIFI